MQTTVTPNSGPEASKLAIKLIEWNYGPVCKELVRSLVHHGRQSLQELIVTSQLPKEALKVCILVLVQQNCVIVNQSSMTGRKDEYLYEADVARILQIVRIPMFTSALSRFLPKAEREIGKYVLQSIIHHGRLGISDITEHVLEYFEDTGEIQTSVLAEHVVTLIERRVLERAPMCSVPPAPEYIHLKARKRKASRTHEDEDAEAMTIARERARLDHSMKRFQIDAEIQSKIQSKKKADQDNVLWRANFEELNRLLWNNIVLEAFKNEHDALIVQVVEAMLAAPFTASSDFYTTSESPCLDVHMIANVSGTIHESPLNQDRIKQVLSRCERGSKSPLLACIVRVGSSYKVDTLRALTLVRNASLLALIDQRFGSSAKRIWNMLYIEGQMEQRVIATEAMMHNTEAREILYAMLRNGFISLQDVPRNPDRAPSRTFYTWRATMETACARACVMLYRTANNLLARMAHETAMHSELLHRVHLVNQGRMDSSQLDAASLHKLKRTVRIIEASLISVDSQLSTFLFEFEQIN